MKRRRPGPGSRWPWGTWPPPDRAPKPKPGRTPEELRRLDALDVSLTLHCAALFMMAPTAGE